jgi:alcohol dehydrogenase class IV
MNALAHCVDALWSPGATPVTMLLAEEGTRALREGLDGIVAAPDDLDARGRLLYGASLGGWALEVAGTSLHHKTCHVLGGMFDLPHAELHAALLPYTAAFLLPAAPEAGRRIAAALESDDPAAAIAGLARDVGTPRSLAALGLTEDDAVRAAAVAAPDVPEKPRRPTPAELEDLLRSAVRGV